MNLNKYYFLFFLYENLLNINKQYINSNTNILK